ncbi:MAG TPA: anaerobic ribonucleoside-triphosphate reductase activating protein [Firmicutes bacterium]|nr:anaerobic ribonucleoside-triphosphate reductase activating protein [Bacillota bacterium]
MDFSGWEKLSLLDFDEHISTTLFVAGCDFRCPFCHNSSLVLAPGKAPRIPWQEIMNYLSKRKGILDAVCISGGEPTMMEDLKEKIGDIKSLGYEVKLDTNGSRPEVLQDLLDKKLIDYVAMDIKNSKEKYAMTSGVLLELSKVEKSIDILKSSQIPFEFRTTAILEYHSLRDFEEIGKWIKGAPKYFIQRYIDNENCIRHGLHELPKEKALEAKALLEKNIGFVDLRGYSV